MRTRGIVAGALNMVFLVSLFPPAMAWNPVVHEHVLWRQRGGIPIKGSRKVRT